MEEFINWYLDYISKNTLLYLKKKKLCVVGAGRWGNKSQSEP